MTSPWQDAPRRREPIFNMPQVVTWTASLLLLLYFLFVLQPHEVQMRLVWDFAFIPARLGQLPPEYASLPHSSFAWGLLTMVTHAGLHGSLLHVGFNVAWLAAFGTIVARVAGTRAYLITFLVGAAAGAAVFWAVHPGDVVPVVGASGGISALMGAAARFFYGPGMARLTDPRILTFTAIWLAVNLIFGVGGFGAGGETGQIAWEAHMGGYFAGLLLIPYLLPRGRHA
jgi:membrane associated rhomboid family serine protease